VVWLDCKDKLTRSVRVKFGVLIINSFIAVSENSIFQTHITPNFIFLHHPLQFQFQQVLNRKKKTVFFFLVILSSLSYHVSETVEFFGETDASIIGSSEKPNRRQAFQRLRYDQTWCLRCHLVHVLRWLVTNF